MRRLLVIAAIAVFALYAANLMLRDRRSTGPAAVGGYAALEQDLVRPSVPPTKGNYPARPPGAVIPSRPSLSTGAIATSGPNVVTNVRDEHHLMKDPAYRATRRQQIRGAMERNYTAFGAETGLDPAQSAKLIDLLTENQMALMSTLLPSTPGKQPHPGEVQAAIDAQREHKRQLQQDLTALLGSAGVAQFREYEASLPARRLVTRLEGTVAALGFPITDDQAKAIVGLIAKERSQPGAGSGDGRTTGSAAGTTAAPPREEQALRVSEGNDRIISKASVFLHPQQVRALAQLLE